MTQHFDVMVLGAGMVGATAALALARKGYSIALIERQPMGQLDSQITEQYDLRVSAVSPASQQLLGNLGVWQDVRQLRSYDYHHMSIWHENGTASMSFSAEQIGLSHLGTIIENRLLQSVLMKHLQHLPNVTIFDEQQVQSVLHLQNVVQITTTSAQLLQADLLLAADGRGSTIRELLHLPVTSGSYQQTAIVANVTTAKGHRNTAWQRFLASGPLAFLPLENGQSSIVWSVDTPRAEELLQMTEDNFKAELGKAFQYKLGEIKTISRRAGFPLSWHAAEKWLEQRVMLIGDAAHGVHPLAGQGVNLGFADIAQLDRLLNAGQSAFQHKLLRKFERQRKAETRLATHLFTALKLIYSRQSPLVCKTRDLGMSIVDDNLLIKRMVLQSAVHNMV